MKNCNGPLIDYIKLHNYKIYVNGWIHVINSLITQTKKCSL